MQWKPVKGYETIFAVSENGDVWSHRTKKILKPSVLKTGYYTLTTYIGGRKGKAICKRVHRLVAEAFLEKVEGKDFINHIDGNKINNHFTNLEWVTSKENHKHAVDMGLTTYDHLHLYNKKIRKLSKRDVEFIRSYYQPRDKLFGARKLAKLLDTTHDRIVRIANYTSYVDV